MFACAVGCTTGKQRPPERNPPPSPPVAPKATTPALDYMTSTRITATADGAFVIDGDTGTLLSIDRNGSVLAQRAIARDAGMLAYDPEAKRIYVADRTNDYIDVVDANSDLAVIAQWRTPAEPYGVALTPDRKTVIVTTIADRALVAFDATSGAERWRTRLSSGARGLTIAPGGTLALVSTVAASYLELVELDGEHRVAEIPYDLSCERCQITGAFARGSGAVRFIDDHRAIATYQRSIPEALIDLTTGLYGGGEKPPVTQHVAFFTFSTDGVVQRVARIAEHQPRAFVWEPSSDTAYVIGMGSDTLLKLPNAWAANADTVEAAADNFALGAQGRCGPESVAIAPSGEILIWCAFTRTVMSLSAGQLRQSAPLVASALTPEQQRGRVLFYGTTDLINRDHALACASCHTDGQADGLSWKIGPDALQTPMLAGRLAGTHPYKWAGTDKTLPASFKTTVRRLGGRGLSPTHANALAAYLQSLPRPRAPTRDAATIERGKLVFEGAGGCTQCHEGALLTDGERHTFTGSTLIQADTPSLIGLAASAPYYHDGSAATLADLVEGRGSVHMVDFDKLTSSEREDLRTYLESL